LGLGGGVNLVQVINAFDGIVLGDRRKYPTVFQHPGVNDGDADDVLEAFQLAKNQCAVRPRARK